MKAAVKTHAKYPPSASERWMNCPGSIALSEKAPKKEESEYAKEGTAAHECLATMLKNRNRLEQTGKLLQKSGKYNSEMIAHAYSATKEILKWHGGGNEILIEQEVKLDHISRDLGGTLDVALVEEFGLLHIIDYKYGSGVPVSPAANSQLLIYGIGVARLFDYNFETVRLTIIQPRAPHEDGTIRSWECSIDYLKDFEQHLGQSVARCEVSKPRLATGDWCRWCPASLICPETSTKALKQAQIDFAPDSGAVALPELQFIQPQNLGVMLNAADKLETWIGELRKYAFQTLSRGESVPGYKLVEKRSIRKWTNLNETEKAAKKLFGDKAFSHDLLSPAQLEKVVGEKWVNARCSAVSSGLTLVEESDPRQAINQIELDFQPTEGEKDETKKKSKSRVRG